MKLKQSAKLRTAPLLFFIFVACVLTPKNNYPETYSGRSQLNIPFHEIYHANNFHIFRDDNHNNTSTLSCNLEKKRGLQVYGFYGQTNDETAIKKYLLPFDRTSLKVIEDSGVGRATFPNGPNSVCDFIADNLGVRTTGSNFASTLNFTPKQSIYGANISGFWGISNNYWAQLNLPIIHVRNKLQFIEHITNNGTAVFTTNNGLGDIPAYANMTAAFKNPKMLYGKIDDTAADMQKTGIGDVTIKLGKTIFNEEQRYAHIHLGALVPGGNKPKSRYLFEAIVGNNQHFGGLIGSSFGKLLKESDSCNIWLAGTSETTYLFENTQKRSLDLVQRSWSRYVAIYANDAQRLLATDSMRNNTWGINYFTQDVKVKPYFNSKFNLSLNFLGTQEKMFVIGYQGVIRMAEDIQLANAWVQGPEISALTENSDAVIPERGINTTDNDFNNEASFYISGTDFDLTSCAQPFSTDNTIFALAQKHFIRGEKIIDLEAGGSYTFCASNATPNRWNIMVGIQVQI